MNPKQLAELRKFDQDHIGFSKGSLSFALIITRALKSHDFPVSADSFRTAKEGQVKGLGGGAVRKILKDYGIDRILSDEGGRTSRGNLGRLGVYTELLNALWHAGSLDLDEVEKYWVERVESYFDAQPFVFRLDPAKSLRFCVRHLLAQAFERQKQVKGTMFAGAMMQHLVGAKLDIISSVPINHHGFAVADAPTNRSGDFLVGDISFHVTTAPSDALARKCDANLRTGLRPVIVTTEDGVGGAKALSRQYEIEDRVDIVEIEQFIATNVYEWSKFEKSARGDSVRDLVARYNRIVADVERDPSFRIEIEG